MSLAPFGSSPGVAEGAQGTVEGGDCILTINPTPESVLGLMGWHFCTSSSCSPSQNRPTQVVGEGGICLTQETDMPQVGGGVVLHGVMWV